MSYSTVSSWLQGINYSRIDKIELMTNYFGISKVDLVENHKTIPNFAVKIDPDDLRQVLLYGYNCLWNSHIGRTKY